MPDHDLQHDARHDPEPTRQYIFSEAQTRLFFVGSGVMMVAALVGILIMAFSRPQGGFLEPDRRQHLQTLELAAEALAGSGENADGSVTLPIERAMQLVAERGVADALTALPALPEAAEPGVIEPEASFDPALGGEALFNANCATCHQANGEGVPGAFPPLAGHLSELYNAEGGRSYLINVVLHGLQGALEVNGQTYNGVMPAFAQLADAEVAAILNHELTSWGNEALLEAYEPITETDVANEREATRTGVEVLELRPALP